MTDAFEAYKSIEYVPVDQLEFDPQNPRLPNHLKGASEPAVLEWMLRDATIIELMGSLGQTGYFPGEPMLVARKNGSDRFEVVEGNRRLAAVKLLRNPDLAPAKKKSVQSVAAEASEYVDVVPVVIYDDRSEILEYLGYRHITGIKEWDPLEKARYLDQLYKKATEPTEIERYRSAARTIGSRADYVGRLITGLRVYETIEEHDFFDLPGVGPEKISFSVLTTALNYSSIAQYIGLEDRGKADLTTLRLEHLRKLTSWMFEANAEGRTRLGESRRLADLSRVVTHEEALQAFESGMPLVDAGRLTQEPEVVFRAAVNASRDRLKEARDNLHHVESPLEGDVVILGDILKMSRSLRDSLQAKLEAAAEVL